MYNVVSVMILALLLFSVGIKNPQTIEDKLVYNANYHVKKLISINGGHCSSTIINYKNKIRHLTNAHCCTVPMSYENEFVKFIKIDIPNDLCEITHIKMSKTGINLSQEIPKLTNIVYTIGFPSSYELTIDQGRIVSSFYISSLNQQFLYRTTAFVVGGSSGGAALDKNGNLFGIVSQGNGIGHGAFIPLTTVREFLKE